MDGCCGGYDALALIDRRYFSPRARGQPLKFRVNAESVVDELIAGLSFEHPALMRVRDHYIGARAREEAACCCVVLAARLLIASALLFISFACFGNFPLLGAYLACSLCCCMLLLKMMLSPRRFAACSRDFIAQWMTSGR